MKDRIKWLIKKQWEEWLMKKMLKMKKKEEEAKINTDLWNLFDSSFSSLNPKRNNKTWMKSTKKKILIIFSFQLCIATLAAIIRTILYATASCMNYLGNECEDGQVLVTEDTSSGLYVFFTAFGTWILMFTNFVPISLLLTLEMVKLWQA